MDELEFPFITRVLYQAAKDDIYQYPKISLNNLLKNQIENNIGCDHNLRNIFRIYSSKEAEYIYIKNEFIS